MNRPPMVVALMAAPALALSIALGSGVAVSSYESDESRSPLFNRSMTSTKRSGIVCNTPSSWEIATRNQFAVAGRMPHSLTRQPTCVRLSLFPDGNAPAQSEYFSAKGGPPNGPTCSVVNPDPTGPPTVCMTGSFACPEPIGPEQPFKMLNPAR